MGTRSFIIETISCRKNDAGNDKEKIEKYSNYFHSDVAWKWN